MNTASRRLHEIINQLGDIAIAVSGGVDSLTLATFSHRMLDEPLMVHAVSPAVPAAATARVRNHAAREGWDLVVLDAGEFADERYRANPVDRCYFCKSNLYGRIREHTSAAIASGTNRDDLSDFLPGLKAATEIGVVHPYVEAGIDKASVRVLARELGLGDMAELPAAPCLSSRLETGIRIEADTLGFVHAVEKLVSAALQPQTVRCRVRAAGIVVELDQASLKRLSEQERQQLRTRIKAQMQPARSSPDIQFACYQTGSAFLTGQS
jgi:uncharacterized protein